MGVLWHRLTRALLLLHDGVGSCIRQCDAAPALVAVALCVVPQARDRVVVEDVWSPMPLRCTFVPACAPTFIGPCFCVGCVC